MTRTEYINARDSKIPAAVLHADRVAPDAAICPRPSDKVAGEWNATYGREMERLSPSGTIPSQKFVPQAIRAANRVVPRMAQRTPNPQTGGFVVPDSGTIDAWEFAYEGFLAELCADAGIEV
jgi:hypothetical protein